MRTIPKNTTDVKPLGYKCGSCSILYYDYKQLVEHLYWRHGTESYYCKKCSLKRWNFATHMCNILPIDGNEYEDIETSAEDSECYTEKEATTDHEKIYCVCQKYVADADMIGCDDPNCKVQWYHFSCVGITVPPAGDWICSQCVKLKEREK